MHLTSFRDMIVGQTARAAAKQVFVVDEAGVERLKAVIKHGPHPVRK